MISHDLKNVRSLSFLPSESPSLNSLFSCLKCQNEESFFFSRSQITSDLLCVPGGLELPSQSTGIQCLANIFNASLTYYSILTWHNSCSRWFSDCFHSLVGLASSNRSAIRINLLRRAAWNSTFRPCFARNQCQTRPSPTEGFSHGWASNLKTWFRRFSQILKLWFVPPMGL